MVQFFSGFILKIQSNIIFGDGQMDALIFNDPY